MSENPLSRLNSRPRVTPEAERSILGAESRPALVETPRDSTGNREGNSEKVAPIDSLSLQPVEDKKALNVRVPKSVFDMVHKRVKTLQSDGVPITKDALITKAIQMYFGLE